METREKQIKDEKRGIQNKAILSDKPRLKEKKKDKGKSK